MLLHDIDHELHLILIPEQQSFLNYPEIKSDIGMFIFHKSVRKAASR